MRLPSILSLLTGTALLAQAPAPTPTVTWRGGIWTSFTSSSRNTVDSSLFLRPVDTGNQQATVDGLTLGADVALGSGWAFRSTVMGGRTGELINSGNGQTGTVAIPEAQLVWTGEKDILRIGRMNTFLGMEFTDGTQNITASRGLLFNFAVPFVQVGINWHHSLSISWSTDVWVFNGEDRVKDNNSGKTVGLGLNYNHGGASDKFLSFGAYRGPEQTSIGVDAIPHAESRARERFFCNGQWVWNAFTLQWEAEYAREPFLAPTFGGKPGDADITSTWHGLGLIGKYQFTKTWAGFFRLEQFKDSTGLRLGGDPSIAALFAAGTLGTRNLDLSATNLTVGAERTWGKTFWRLEVRMDRLKHDVPGTGGSVFRDAVSSTLAVGTSF